MIIVQDQSISYSLYIYYIHKNHKHRKPLNLLHMSVFELHTNDATDILLMRLLGIRLRSIQKRQRTESIDYLNFAPPWNLF